MAEKIFQEGAKLVSEIRVFAPNELKHLAGESADVQGIPLSEFVVRLLARHFRRPDLAIIPRKRMGRPRKELAGAK